MRFLLVQFSGGGIVPRVLPSLADTDVSSKVPNVRSHLTVVLLVGDVEKGFLVKLVHGTVRVSRPALVSPRSHDVVHQSIVKDAEHVVVVRHWDGAGQGSQWHEQHTKDDKTSQLSHIHIV